MQGLNNGRKWKIPGVDLCNEISVFASTKYDCEVKIIDEGSNYVEVFRVERGKYVVEELW